MSITTFFPLRPRLRATHADPASAAPPLGRPSPPPFPRLAAAARPASLAVRALAALAFACPARAADWPPQVQSLLDDFRQGHLELVARAALRLSNETADPTLRREARALYALTLLHGPERRERLHGRSILAELASQDPGILDRPDCLLASGFASLALNETPAALNELDLAARKFVDQARADLAARALRALAEAWASHGEWERTPSHLNLPTPAGPQQVRSARLTQIERVLARIAELPLSPARLDALASVHLTLADALLADPADAPRAVDLLRHAIDSNPDPAILAALARRLAAHYEQHQQWSDAVALYRRVADLAVGEPSDFALRRLTEITRTDVRFDAPHSVPPDQPFTWKLSVRNAQNVRYELRRVDLSRFLSDAQGRLVESRLPDDGAIAASGELDTPAMQPHGWWSSDAISLPPLAPGAYALLVRTTGARVFKQLLIATDLRAVVVTGSRRLLAWAARGDSAPLGSASLEFWMHGSFNPTRVAFDNGVAASVLPPETRVLRDRAWVAIVRAADQIALCRGELAPQQADQRAEAPCVALMPSAMELLPGDALTIAGLLFAPGGGRAAPPSNLQLDVIDVDDRLYWSAGLKPTADGAFLARLPITTDMANRSYRVVIRSADGVLTNLARQTTFAVRESEGWEGLAHIGVPAWTPTADALLRANLRSVFPWGTPYSEGEITLHIEGVQLPDDDSPSGMLLEPVHAHVHTDPRGAGDYARPLEQLGLTGPNAALAITARVSGHERTLDVAQASTLIMPNPVQVLVSVSAGRGETCRATVRVIDPLGLAADEPPSLEARGPAGAQALPLLPRDDGFVSAEWNRRSAGFTTLAATQKLRDGAAAAAEVAADLPSLESDLSRLQVRVWENAPSSGTPSATVELRGREARPLLAILDDGEPWAAVPIRLDDGVLARVALPISKDVSRSAAQVLVVAMSDDGAMPLAAGDVEFDAEMQPPLRLDTATRVVGSGAVLEAEITLASQAPTSVALRLVDLNGAAVDAWWAAFAGDAPPREVVTGLRIGGPRMMTPASSDGLPRALSRPAREALLAGGNAWVDQPLISGGRWTAHVPIPNRRGRYRLVAAARLADGRIVSAARTLTAVGIPQARLFVPEILEIGDRSTAIAVVDNPTREPLDLSVRIDAGSASIATSSVPTTLRVGAGATERIVLPIEPPRVGRDEMSVTFAGGSTRLEARAAFEVASPIEIGSGGLGMIGDEAEMLVSGGESRPARIHLQADLAEVVLDAAAEWLDASFESTAVLLLQFSWADALMTLNPGARDDTLASLLSPWDRGGIGTRRLRRIGGWTLREFHEVAARKLAGARALDGGWPRWKELATDAEMTGWALAVLSAPAATFSPPIDLRPAFGFLVRSTPVSSGAGDRDAGVPRLLAAAVAGSGGVKQESIIEQREKWQRALGAMESSLSGAERATWAFALGMSGGRAEARRLLADAPSTSATHPSRWEIVLRAAAQAIAEEGNRDGVSVLLASRSGVGWGEPLLTALALQGVARSEPIEPRAASAGAKVRAGNETRGAAHDGNWQTHRHLTVEAERIGVSGCLTAAVEGAAASDPGLRIVVKRTLFRVVPVMRETGKEEWEWQTLRAEQPVEPGTLLVVRDEIEAAGPLSNVEWVQRYPATARSWRPKAVERHLGHVAQRNGLHAVFVTRRLEGPAMHETWMMASYPGACGVPAPEVTVDGVRATVEMRPTRDVVRVEE